MTPYRILRHPSVITDLHDIADLITEYASVDIALKKIDEIETSIRNLAQTPHIGTLRHEIIPNLRAIPTAQKGVISFIVDDKTQTVLIISITYAGADWMNLTRNRS